LCVAYRRYLRFDHPVATVLASQAIVVLALLVFVVNVDTPISEFWRTLLTPR